MRVWRFLTPLFALAAVCGGIAAVAPRVYNIGQWNSGPGPMLLCAWGMALLFAVASLSCGARLLRWAYAGRRPDGFWPLSFATGAGAFTLLDGFGGWVGLLGVAWFVLMPLGLLAWGWRTVVHELAAVDPTEQRWSAQFSWLELLVLAFGVGCLGLVALQTLSPDNVNYDAAMYHLRGAERYALAGRMVHTLEGSQLLTLPQNATWLYTWAFLWPKVTIDDRVRLALLLEFATVVGTLAAIPALVRALCPSLPRELTRLSWVAFFFFPSIFIYDTGIMGGADHVVGLWAVGSILTWLNARKSQRLGAWALFGLHLAGLMAKFSGLYVLLPVAAMVAAEWAWRLRESRVARWGPVLAAFAALVLTSPYWLRNILWHHNPIYPQAGNLFPSTPWNQDAQAWLANFKESTWFTENGTAWWKFKISTESLFTYQTEIHTWGDFTQSQPMIGSIYFLSLLALPFIQDKKRRLVMLAFIFTSGIYIWFNTHQHHHRFLIVLMAPMAAGAAAVSLSLWRSRRLLARAAVLVGAGWHLAAYGDVPFRKTHRMASGNSTVGIASDWLGRHGGRIGRFQTWEQIGEALPPNAVPLVHGSFPHLGLGRQSVTDATSSPGLQFGINYGRWGSEAAILENLKKLGVTHLIVYSGSEQTDSVTGEALFLGLATQVTEKKSMHGYTIGELPDKAREIGEGILYVGCGHLYQSGLYTLEALKPPVAAWYHPWPEATPVTKVENNDWRPLLPRASFVALEGDCNLGDPPASEFTYMNEQVGFPRKLRHFVRTAGQAQGWPAPAAAP